jgi:hypothetical protein
VIGFSIFAFVFKKVLCRDAEAAKKAAEEKAEKSIGRKVAKFFEDSFFQDAPADGGGGGGGGSSYSGSSGASAPQKSGSQAKALSKCGQCAGSGSCG